MSHNSVKLQYIIFNVALLLFPVLPQYIYIVGEVNMVYSLVILFYFSLIISRRIILFNIQKHILIFWIYESLIAVLCTIYAGIINGVVYAVTFIIFPCCIVGYINTKARFIKAIDVLIFGGFILGIFGMLEQAFRINVFQLFANGELQLNPMNRYGFLRVMVTFGQPIGYGLYQVFIIALIYYRLNLVMEYEKKRYLKLAYIISLVNILLTVSRLPIIAYMSIQILLIYKKSKKTFIKCLLLGIIILFIMSLLGEIIGFKIPLFSDLIQTVHKLLQGKVSSADQDGGIGNRWDLWFWVFDSMRNAWIFGHGATAQFAYKVYDWFIKTSIENHYLMTLYNYGIIGVISLLLMYASTLCYTYKNSKRIISTFGENKVTFNKVVFVLLGIYYIVVLGVQETDLSRMYVIIISLVIAYNRINYKIGRNIRCNRVSDIDCKQEIA